MGQRELGYDGFSNWWAVDEAGSTRLFRRFADHIEFVSEEVAMARAAPGPVHLNVWGALAWEPDRLTCEMDPIAGWTLDELRVEGPIDPLAAIAVALDLCDAAVAVRSEQPPFGRGPTAQFTVVTTDGVVRVEAPALAWLRQRIVIT